MPNSETLDEKVVEMRIDNRQFVKGANESISALDKLKASLNFGGAAKGLDEITKASNRVDVSNLSSALSGVEDRLEYLGSRTKRVVDNMIDDMYRFAKRTIESLSTDQISQGWGKYEEMTSSIHTIMGATASKWDKTLERISKDYGFVGSQMEYVTSQVEKLNWFTDETSASLTDMTNNIGKFTNAGVELDQAVISMMGISTWGYKSGATVSEISRAMYNLSQAMALGEVRLMDWRSIENANMATLEFKQSVIDTAVKLGTLKKVSDGVYQTLKGTSVTATNFSESLSEGWFSADVLQASLYKYGHFANSLQHITDVTGVSTRDMLEMVEDYKNGVFDAVKWQNELYKTMSEKDVPSVNALNEAMSELTKEEDDLGYRAFLASQETKTLAEAIEYTKDAVSSGWMQTFQYVFGDYEEAKAFWGDVTDELYELFVKAGERRNSIFKLWHEQGGRDDLLEAIWNLYEAVTTLVQPIKDAFSDVFGWGSIEEASSKLLELTKRFKEFTERIVISEDTLKGMKVVFTKIFEAAKKVLEIAKKIASVFFKAFGYLTKIIGAFFRAFSSGRFDSNRFLKELNEIFGGIVSKVKESFASLKKFIEGLYDIPVLGPILKIIITVFEKLVSVVSYAINKLKNFRVTSEALSGPLAFINDIFERIWKLIKNINIDGEKIDSLFTGIGDAISNMWTGSDESLGGFKERVTSFLQSAWNIVVDAARNLKFSDLFDVAKAAMEFFVAFKLAKMISAFTTAAKAIETVPEAFKRILVNIGDTFNSIKKSVDANRYIKIAVAVGILAWSILQLSKIDPDQFATIALTLVTVFALLAKAAKSLEGSEMFSSKQNFTKNKLVVFSTMAQNIIAFGVLIAAAAYAIKSISDLDIGQALTGLVGITVLLAIMVGAIYLLSKIDNEKITNKTAINILAFSVALYAVGKALTGLAAMSLENIATAGIVMAAVISSLALALYASSKIQSSGSVAVVLLAIAAVIIALIPAIAVLALIAKIDIMSLVASIGAIVVLMGAIAGFMAVGGIIASKFPKLMVFATVMAIIAGSLLLLSIALAVAVPSIISLGAAFTGLVAVISQLSDDTWSKILIRLVELGFALIPLTFVFVGIGAAVLAFGLGLLSASAAIGLFSFSILGVAASIALIALAIELIIEAVTKLVESVDKYGDRFLEILENVFLAVIGLIVGYKLLIANATITIILSILTLLATDGGDALLQTIAIVLAKLLVFLNNAVGTLVNFLVDLLVNILETLADAIDRNAVAIRRAIEKIVGKLVSILVQTLWSVLVGVVRAMFGWLFDLLGVSIDEINATVQKSFEDIDSYVMTAFEHGQSTTEAAGKMVAGSYASSVSDTAQQESDPLKSTIETLTDNATFSSIGIAEDNGYLAGYNLMAGESNGILDGYVNELLPAIEYVNGQTISDTMAGLGEHSPSVISEGIAYNWIKGFANGVENNVGVLKDSNKLIVSDLESAILGAMNLIHMIADEDFSIKPTIKPVVDLDGVTSAASSMSSIFNNLGQTDTTTIGARVKAVSDASRIASNMDAFREKFTQPTESVVINVYSQPGMDTNELANVILYKFQNSIFRRGASLG